MKKLIIIIFAVIFLTACIGPDEDEGKIVLEFWTLQLGTYKDYIQGMIEEYESKHPDIKIKWLDVPFKEGEKRALAASMSNKIPDLINLNPSFASTLASKKALINFDDYLTPEQKDLYLDEAWNAGTLGDFAFGIPWYITSSITIYNQSDLEKAQISDPPHNYDDLMKQSAIIKKELDHYAFMPSLTEGDYFLKILVKNNVRILSNTNPPQAIYNSEDAVQILQKWIDIYDSEIIPPESIVSTHQEAVDKFQSGSTTFIVIGPNFLKSIQDNAPKLYQHVNLSSQIVGSSNKVDFSIMNFVIPIRSKHKKEAVDFALFITSSKNQLAFSKLTPTLPSSKKALNDKFFTAGNCKTLEDKARIISASQLRNGAQALPVIKNQQEFLSIMNYYIQKALLKKLSAKQALDRACADWNKKISP